ncbi:MAG: hypothetical protein V7746_01220 [Halioglobus sp.]
MVESTQSGYPAAASADNRPQAMSIVQRGNLKNLEQTLRKQWRLGQSIVLCWSADERGLLVIFVPHYFLGNYCAVEESGGPATDNEAFIRDLVSGVRRKSRDELFAVADRLGVAPTFIKLDTALAEDPVVESAVEELIRRYGLSYVDARAVLLFDISDFSLYTPFEQASQLNSLSYSLNSAYNKLLAQGIEVNFARTTTGDGYYVWNRNLGAQANQWLFYFMLLVIADNSAARSASKGNTVPVIRTAYHIGSHYELYQAEGVSPTVFSYIVGDVTIELARMIDLAQPDQIMVGEFQCDWMAGEDSTAGALSKVSSARFVSNCSRELASLKGLQLSGKSILSVKCQLTAGDSAGASPSLIRFRITDKHGLDHYAFNLQAQIALEEGSMQLGLERNRLPCKEAAVQSSQKSDPAENLEVQCADNPYDDLALILKKRKQRMITEE